MRPIASPPRLTPPARNRARRIDGRHRHHGKAGFGPARRRASRGLEEVAATFTDAGYDRRPDDAVPNRVLLAGGPSNGRTHYLSVTERGNDAHRDQVAFRGYWRENPEVGAVYATLKKALAERPPTSGSLIPP